MTISGGLVVMAHRQRGGSPHCLCVRQPPLCSLVERPSLSRRGLVPKPSAAANSRTRALRTFHGPRPNSCKGAVSYLAQNVVEGEALWAVCGAALAAGLWPSARQPRPKRLSAADLAVPPDHCAGGCVRRFRRPAQGTGGVSLPDVIRAIRAVVRAGPRRYWRRINGPNTFTVWGGDAETSGRPRWRAMARSGRCDPFLPFRRGI